MEKQNYSKPFMVKEEFMPQHYCWVCYPANSSGVYAPFRESNGLPGLQINGTSTNWHGTTQNYPGDTKESNWDGTIYVRCDPPAYRVWPRGSSDKPSDGATLDQWESYYTHGDNTGQGVWVFHDISGETFYKINLQSEPESIASNHS